MRTCADFATRLNTPLDTYKYQLMVLEDLFAKLNGGRCFVKLDFCQAYLRAEAADESREPQLLTFIEDFKHTRLPFGI